MKFSCFPLRCFTNSRRVIPKQSSKQINKKDPVPPTTGRSSEISPRIKRAQKSNSSELRRVVSIRNSIKKLDTKPQNSKFYEDCYRQFIQSDMKKKLSVLEKNNSACNSN